MILVSDHQPPQEFIAWIAQQRQHAPQNLAYVSLPEDIRRKVRETRLIQQRFLCPYTQVKLRDADSCHIEHMDPQTETISVAGQQNAGLQYDNMIACFPASPRLGTTEPGFGARKKGGTAVTRANFVFPTDADCEARFVFAPDGSVAAQAGDEAAASAIEILDLTHSHLAELREKAIADAGLRRGADNAVSAKAAERLAAATHTAHKLPEFAVALRQVAIAYAERERRASRRKAGRAQR